mgnify:CR=1 FL=1
MQKQLQKVHTSALDSNVRVTIIAKDGTVLADSDLKNVDGMENHLDRQEVKEALEKGEGSAIRYSESLGQEMLYVAKLSEDGKAIIRMFDSLHRPFPVYDRSASASACRMIVAFVVSVAVAARYSGYIRSDEIKRQMVQMERDRKIRQEFFSNASHELKTPITSVRGYAELLSQDFVKDEATRKDFLGRILKETEHMTSLIDDILMISRLESKDAEVTLSKVNLKSVMDEVLESLTPQAASCKVEISAPVEM